jgi:hypothetical protein
MPDMEEKNLTEHESLQIIRQMIETAKHEQKDDGIGWIAWGWTLFAISILTYFNIQFGWFDVAFFWNAFGVMVGLYFLFYLFKTLFMGKTQRVRTYTKDIFDRLNAGFFIFLILIIVSINVGVPPNKGFMLLIGLYGFFILIYGTALDFRRSIIGAYVSWAIAFAGLFIDKFIHPEPLNGLAEDAVRAIGLERFQWVMLFHALAVLCGYIIPGHIAYKEFKKIKKGDILPSV